VAIPIIACGGMGKWADIVEATDEGNASKAAAGKLLCLSRKKESGPIQFSDTQRIKALVSKI